jgi:hypothetical protein
MSADLVISSTAKSPLVIFHDGVLWIKGRSIMEDAWGFYSNLLKWIDEYKNTPCHCITIKIMLEYSNDQGLKFLLRVLEKLADVQMSKDCSMVIDWYYEKYDDDMKEIIFTFREILDHVQLNPRGVDEFR